VADGHDLAVRRERDAAAVLDAALRVGELAVAAEAAVGRAVRVQARQPEVDRGPEALSDDDDLAVRLDHQCPADVLAAPVDRRDAVAVEARVEVSRRREGNRREESDRNRGSRDHLNSSLPHHVPCLLCQRARPAARVLGRLHY
jgi:hypothetical protein